jgi:hypothetical protein
MKETNFIDSALKVIQIEANAVLALKDQIHGKFDDLCKNILKVKGKLILMVNPVMLHKKFQQLYLVQALHHFLYIQQRLLMVILG